MKVKVLRRRSDRQQCLYRCNQSAHKKLVAPPGLAALDIRHEIYEFDDMIYSTL